MAAEIMNGDLDDLRARIERLEATEQIRQLAARYALALDSRDVPTLASLFVPDVTTGDGRVGREALAEWFDPVLRPVQDHVPPHRQPHHQVPGRRPRDRCRRTAGPSTRSATSGS